MRFRTTTIALAVIAFASIATACSVPVFRYALEHWRPDPYVAYVFHDGELSKEQQSIANSMQPKGPNGAPIANLAVKVVDINDDLAPVIAEIWKAHKTEELPTMVVRTPPKIGPPETIWQGELTANNASTVMGSPARSQVSKKLIDGESVVWVYLESGQKDEDDRLFTLLNSELDRLEKKLKLPDVEVEDLGDLSVDPDTLKIKFSALRISRDDAKEKAFVQMLLHVEPDLLDLEFSSQPMAFPIFGRGRALYALVGKGIAPDVIEEAAQFLTGACQCTVKAQNPGVDLIMNLDWDKLVIPTETLDEGLPPLAGFSGFGESDEAVEMEETGDEVAAVAETQGDTIDSASGSQESLTIAASPINNSNGPGADVGSSMMGKNILFVLGFLAIGVVVASVFVGRRAN